jgi:hypothetical protein
MASHVERIFPRWLVEGLLSDHASRGRSRKRVGRRFEAALLSLEDRGLLSMFPVTSTADDGSTGTLRWAVAGAKADTTPSMIVFELGTAPATITLTQGQLELSNTSEPVAIYDGTGQGPVTISGNDQSGAFQVDSGVTASISGLTIIDGSATSGGGGVFNEGSTTLVNCTISGNTSADGAGGGLYNTFSGHLKAYGTTISGNTSSNEGAGVYNDGTAYLSGCTISGNSNNNSGGGVWNRNSIDVSGCTVSGNNAFVGGGLENEGTATVTDCTISQNTASKSGGGVANGFVSYVSGGNDTAALTLTGSTISNNTVSGGTSGGGGAGILNDGQASLCDSTIANNFANNGQFAATSGGGGLDDTGTASLVACTVSGNTTTGIGGGIYVGGTGADTVTLNNTIVAGNESAPYGGSVSPSDIIGGSGAVVSGSNDLVGTGGSAGLSSITNLLGVVDPDLGPLGENGGPTETMALLTGSLAIHGGSLALEIGPGSSALTSDQRGLPLDTPSPDIGAYQTQPLINLSFDDLTSPRIPYATASVTISGSLANGNQAPPDSESVQITLDGVMQQARIGTGGAFSTTFDTSTISASATPYTVTYNYAGDANYAAAATTSTLTVIQDTPTVGVTASDGTYKGVAFNATATVTGVSGSAGSSLEGVAPTLTYYAGTTATGTPLSGAPIDVGTYTVVAGFAGSTDYVASASAPATFTISQATPTVNVTDGGTYNGVAFNATANVSGVTGAPANSLEGIAPTVTYYAGTTATGTPLSSAPIDAGSYTVVASFAGSADYVASTSPPATFTISRATPTVNVTDGGTYNGAAFNATANVQGVTGASASSLEGITPTLTYYSGTTATGTPLSSAPIDAGTYTVVAGFAGSADYVANTSVPATFTISRAAPTVSVADAGGTYKGTAFKATATVTGLSGPPASGLEGVTPTPVYYAGTTAAGTPLSTAPTNGGTYTVVAEFPGSTDYSAVQSAPVTFKIGRAGATISPASSGGSAVFGQPVTFVTTVAAGVPAAGVPTGTVTFLDGTTPLATVPLDSSGQADLTTSALAVGSHSIIAIFSGTADFLGVQSASAPEVVSPAATEVVLAPHPVFKKKQLVSVGLTAQVMPIAPGAGVPTGALVFEMFVKGKGKKAKTRTEVLGTATLAGGEATLTRKANQVLKESITIAYSGDADFASSTATPPALTKQALKTLVRLQSLKASNDGRLTS